MAETNMHVITALQKTAVAAAIVALLLMCGPNPALAASGGRMGGSSFPSSQSDSKPTTAEPSVERKGGSSFSPPAAAESDFWYWSPPYYAPPRPYYAACNGACAAPAAVGINSSSPSSRSTFDPTAEGVLMIALVVAVTVIAITLIMFWDDDSERRRKVPREKTSVLKLQILGLLGIERSVQKELNQIAETADTSTTKGIHHVLTETVVALLRHPEYFLSTYTSVDVKRSSKEGERGFNEQSIKERVKFDEETLVNINNKQKRSPSAPCNGGFGNEYIVITILVAARGELMLPSIKNINELKEALRNLASIPLDSTLGVEVLWTPQNEADTLSEQELLQDYPLLKHF
ncbi:hypothetical protein C2S53_003722 [Perilla frutescens var. hirtella]|uniref:DUF1517 domain-containing protein n=1 Tax=Perilla frutescens var. hirtella TaxID=608512 RepID=A0AAD4J381_PERFH|nr:hypothetical protein C2S53_003722 [Perilla frutescens var. hirtella]